MDFYSSLEQIVRQIPKGRLSFLTDVAEALGDRAATVALPQALNRISARCTAAARVVKADGSPVVAGSVVQLKREGLKVERSRVEQAAEMAFDEFETTRPLRKLRASQLMMSKKVVLKDVQGTPDVVAGVDVSYHEDHAYAAAVAVELSTLRDIAQVEIEMDVNFPYVPGYLAFRESPPMLDALRKLPIKPQLIFVDGHGVLHPAKFGIASQIGVTMRIPTIGIGKSYLVGELDSEPRAQGEAVAVRIERRITGYALRSSSGTSPIYVSPGNMIRPRTALKLTKMVCKGRIPEPIRKADAIARENKREKSRL